MKKIIVILAIMTLYSCEKEDNPIPFSAKVLGEWETYKIERQDLFLDWDAGGFVQSVGWIDVTGQMTTELTLEFNEDYSFNALYANVITSGGIWSKKNDDNFSLTFNSSQWSDLQEDYIVNFYCDNTMSIQYLVEAPAGNHDFQNDDWYVIQYYRLPETVKCDDLINYYVNN